MFWEMIKKDFKLIIKDKSYILIVILMPLLLSVILTFALSPAFENDTTPEAFDIAVVKEESEMDKLFFSTIYPLNIIKELPMEFILFDNFLELESVKEIMNYKIVSYEKSIELLKENKIAGVVILDGDLSYKLLYNFFNKESKLISIKIIKNPNQEVNAKILNEIFKGFSEEIYKIDLRRITIIDLFDNKKIKMKFGEISKKIENMIEKSSDININYNIKGLDDKKVISANSYYSAAMLAMFLLFVAGSASTFLLEEKENMTFDRLITIGVSTKNIILGKAVSLFLLSILEIFIMVLFSYFILKVNWGAIDNLMAISLIAAFTISSFGIFLMTLSFVLESKKVSSIANSIVFQIMAALGGSFIPVENLPDFIKNFRYLLFNSVILKGYLNGIKGNSILENKFEFMILLINAFVFLFISYLLMKGKNFYEVSVETTDNKDKI